MSKYAMGVVVDSTASADITWEDVSEILTREKFARVEAVFVGDPYPIADQDEYDSGEAARAILAGVATLRGLPVSAVPGERSKPLLTSENTSELSDAEWEDAQRQADALIGQWIRDTRGRVWLVTHTDLKDGWATVGGRHWWARPEECAVIDVAAELTALERLRAIDQAAGRVVSEEDTGGASEEALADLKAARVTS